ncbi:nitroreductase family protein [Bacillus atrophaeus]|uniref:Oxidoreductase n=1 Tax=Bacillus atrophaeus (strain 1942) TaxID=720555 RepID=A0ABN3ZAU4_BACA1|nr:nitroreductase family protein [Bacillus atrophaeus]AMR62555.1 NAD(P)H nitroreductase [Bacillus subtilis subsp. globigii]ADP32626.1 putative oxidoreductase [Bacillus atrophaeus 1942]AIK47203.1 putative NAD(P)H nitroreductase yodC [Bacillus atrophaeus subsp. globigii]EIM11914.1 putative oxidoreductase [Bacillus atrophaeus C89]KFK84682.1 putative NAD(P)H nitroreductase yodC [Bacillus atrophaeus]
MTNTLDILQQRASVKEYDKNATISKEEMTELLELTTKAPSAWNLQHWHFTVFHSDEAKAALLPVAYNQKQIIESSAVVAVLGDLKANENGEDVYGELAKQGLITDDIKQTLLGQINGAYQNEQFARDSAFLNASLAAMQLMIAAKAKGYDTCAIGGFNKEQFQEQFDVSDRFVPVMLISIGKAVKPAHQSNRLPVSEVSTWL